MQEILLPLLFCAVVFVGLPMIFFVIVYKGLSTGVISAKSQPYRRSESPIFFWILIVLYSGLALGIGCAGLLFGIQLWTHR